MGDVFLLVLAGHLLGDFVVQTDRQAGNKEAGEPILPTSSPTT